MDMLAILLLTVLIGLPVSKVLGLKITYTGPIGDMRGTLNGMTYSIWKAGVAVAKKVASVISNPQSVNQAKMRCNVATTIAAWELLTVAEKALWQDWADTEPGKGNKDGGITNLIKGNGGKMSGFNACLMANQWLKSAGMSPITAPPLGLSVPSAPVIGTVTYALGTVTVPWTDPPEAAAGDKIRVFVTSRNGLIHKQLQASIAQGVQTHGFSGVYGAGGVAVDIEDYPGQYLVQIDCITDDGRKSGPSATKEVTVA